MFQLQERRIKTWGGTTFKGMCQMQSHRQDDPILLSVRVIIRDDLLCIVGINDTQSATARYPTGKLATWSLINRFAGSRWMKKPLSKPLRCLKKLKMNWSLHPMLRSRGPQPCSIRLGSWRNLRMLTMWYVLTDTCESSEIWYLPPDYMPTPLRWSWNIAARSR